MSQTLSCPKCGSPMEDGSVVHQGRYDTHPPAAWVPESKSPALNMAEELVHEHPAYRKVVSHRCGNCGYIESYAP